ncbi:DUF3617 family protein [Henriciella sp.]|uniref:DUF3617 domain-containing protein n=1 Tax=Henriciella sp. TaxID=1968823 RepID=UPI00260F4897|nr:DUF3617 family protein [Henriciella sp.]
MRLKTLAAATALTLFLGGTAAAQGLSVQPGEWRTESRMTGTMQAQGMSMNLPGQTHSSTQCISEEDATFSPDQLAEDGCTTSNVQSTDDSISFDLTCTQQGATINGSMKVSASDGGKTVDGTMNLNGSVPGGGKLDMKGDFSGSHVGACSS